MNFLKALLIFVVVLASVVASPDEDAKREGRCGGSGKGQMKRNKHLQRKPGSYHKNHNFNDVHHNKDADQFSFEGASAIAHSNTGSSGVVQPQRDILPIPLSTDGFNRPDRTPNKPNQEKDFGGDFGLDVRGNFGASPKIRISEDGEVIRARSLNFERRHFHEEDQFDHDHQDHIDEDHDHFHKIRTARNSRPEQLTATLGSLGNSLNSGAHSGDTFQMVASGDSVNAANQESSQVTGSGSMSASGTTSVTSSGGSGWSST